MPFIAGGNSCPMHLTNPVSTFYLNLLSPFQTQKDLRAEKPHLAITTKWFPSHCPP